MKSIAFSARSQNRKKEAILGLENGRLFINGKSGRLRHPDILMPCTGGEAPRRGVTVDAVAPLSSPEGASVKISGRDNKPVLIRGYSQPQLCLAFNRFGLPFLYLLHVLRFAVDPEA